MVEFFVNNKNEIILLFIGFVIGKLFDNVVKLPKYIKSVWYSIRSAYKFIKLKVKGGYTFNEIAKIEDMPLEKRSKRQKAALDKFKKEWAESMKYVNEHRQH